MTVDQILLFFSKYNVAIIEGLVAAIILLGLFVGYRGFFGKKDADSGLGGGLDTAQLEKTLQKILDGQGPSHAKTGDAALDAAFKEGAAGHGESPEEVTQLKVSLSENIKELEVVRAELQISEKKVAELQASATEGGAAAPAAAAAPAVDTSEFENKIKDLEARLAEYEIISEDIADLSRYKEENDKLKTEITTLKEAGPAAPAAAAPQAPVPAPTPEPVAAAPVPEEAPAPTPEPVVEAAPPVEEQAAAPAPSLEETTGLSESDIDAALAAAEKEAAAMAPVPEATEAAAPAEDSSIIDDELMKEFAAAVENQKKDKDLDSVAVKAGKGDKAADGKSAEDTQLMNEFENFVNKKS